jgi:hypothetical protein
MVNCDPDFAGQPKVINGCSDLLLEWRARMAGCRLTSAVDLTRLELVTSAMRKQRSPN